MSTYYPTTCNSCKEEFTTSKGNGFYSTTYRCEDCGKSKRIDHPERRSYEVVIKADQIGVCESCGGTVSQNAKNRCPSCKSDDITIDEASCYSVD